MENHIARLLDRFRNIQPTDKNIKEAFAQVILDRFQENIDIKHVRVENNVVYVTTHPILKSEIHIHKEAILDALKEKVGKRLRSVV